MNLQLLHLKGREIMRAYHPESWSQQARKMCDTQVWNVNHYENYTIEDAVRFFSNSYRHPLIVNRATKRFGRLVREGKVKKKNA